MKSLREPQCISHLQVARPKGTFGGLNKSDGLLDCLRKAFLYVPALRNNQAWAVYAHQGEPPKVNIL